jgi:hypothetical protein
LEQLNLALLCRMGTFLKLAFDVQVQRHMHKLLFLLMPVCLLAQQPVLNDQRIMMLAQSGVSETELLRLVATAPDIDFDLRPVSTDAMMKIGVSQNVIKAMAARESASLLLLRTQSRSLYLMQRRHPHRQCQQPRPFFPRS